MVDSLAIDASLLGVNLIIMIQSPSSDSQKRNGNYIIVRMAFDQFWIYCKI